ncbi:stage II sporulation protein P [Sedimentibacter sp. MB31-C6]|uniref:stage II sporulation protein P n=1 Tax=Sedimentibacter sp. MB31-C6 TaxID=3109366 RepID=UPI002DDD5D0F|nr:stage II sporulation protein P [Sedimentibacter sp. MB36-C1]WSI03937.1 stage II sporulation protein P [Sedimentibacter sp. MB36-C1]
MRRRRRNNSGTKFYMAMSILCLTVLFAGYSYVYNLSEARKTGKEVTTISINYEGEGDEDKENVITKIMSYFNILLEETFKETDDAIMIENHDAKSKEIFKTVDRDNNSEGDLKIYEEEYDYSDLAETEVYLANNRKENFFKVIESPSSRSSVPRDMSIDAASINDNFNIVLYHTHGTESYLPYNEFNYHTKDENYNVVGIGSRVVDNLRSYGLNVMHLKEYNDYPDYNKSYANSNSAVKEVLSNSKKNIIIDLHRDGADENSSYEDFLSRVKTIDINGKKAATCTLVVGTKNGNVEELKNTAQIVFDTANDMYPGLFRDIVIREGAYFNQYLSDFAMLLEVGCTLNNIEEVQYTSELLSAILCKSIEKINK